jgi:hypothetical protein
MLSHADNILPVCMRWIQNFLYYCPVAVTIYSGDMNKNLKLSHVPVRKFESLITGLIRRI